MTTGWVLLSASKPSRKPHSPFRLSQRNRQPWRNDAHNPFFAETKRSHETPPIRGYSFVAGKSPSGNLRMCANGSKEDIARPARNLSPVLLRFDSLSNSF